jgi:hypothetical protein
LSESYKPYNAFSDKVYRFLYVEARFSYSNHEVLDIKEKTRRRAFKLKPYFLKINFNDVLSLAPTSR